MLTIEQIKSDLREIRYYYSKQKEFDGASRWIGKSSVYEKVAKYNEAVCKAPLILYDIYVSLYVNNNTQLAVALDRDCSADYIKRLNKQLCLFLQTELSNKEEMLGEDK